ncbi:hypothetical protein BGX21_006302, partial [Mortierella sp. AD011]
MTSESVKLICVLEGDSSPITIRLAPDDTLGELKDKIKKACEPDLDHLSAKELILWHVSIASSPKRPITLTNLNNEDLTNTPKELEDATCEISEIFGTAPPKKTIHVIVQLPKTAP